MLNIETTIVLLYPGAEEPIRICGPREKVRKFEENILPIFGISKVNIQPFQDNVYIMDNKNVVNMLKNVWEVMEKNT